MKKIVTVGIPAYKAQEQIVDALASIQIQTEVNKVSIIIANDDPEENGTYDFLYDRFPQLDITILECSENGGPGVARQRALDECKTEWITFMDADDILYDSFAISNLLGAIEEDVIEVSGIFLHQVEDDNTKGFPEENFRHPWVFGRMYNVKFLNQNDIRFSKLRAMEDGEFNKKIDLLIARTDKKINYVDMVVYVWRPGSEHSITRMMDNTGDCIPIYNYSMCQVGATAGFINAINFAKKVNPFNGEILKFTVEYMINLYFTYVECYAKKGILAEQNLFNAKRFYHECFKIIENQIDIGILSKMYTEGYAANANNLIGVIPHIDFFSFMEKVKTEEYNGEKEFKEIRSRLPKDIVEKEKITGVAIF